MDSRFNCRVPAELYERFQVWLRAKGMTASEFFRNAIRGALDNGPAQPIEPVFGVIERVGTQAVWYSEADDCLVALLERNRFNNIAIPDKLIPALRAAMCRTRKMVYWNKLPYFNMEGEWQTGTSLEFVRAFLSSCGVEFIIPREGNFDPSKWKYPNTETLEEALRAQGELITTRPESLLKRFLPQGTMPGGRSVQGIVRHPIVGEAHGDWEYNDTDISRLNEETFDGFTRLPHLFAPFELDGPSHAAVYCHLLGCFHARSLDSPRPLLVVDSWEQGRGKSEACYVISYLVDGQEGSITPGGRGEADTMTAHFKNNRCLVIDNVDGVSDYGGPFLANTASGVLHVRWKYGAETAPIHGAVPMLNLIAGAASLHPDILSRAWRVVLDGPSRDLPGGSPLEYARTHRERIIQECLYALEGCHPYPEVSSRTARFDGVVIPAYSKVFGVPETETKVLLAEARRRAWVHHHKVLGNFFKRGDFEPEVGYKNDWQAKRLSYHDIEMDLEGVPLLKYVFKEGKWHETHN